jgi:hypothetical protein
MRDILKIIGGALAGVLLIDAFGFMAWLLSEQHPTDNFYIGTITAHILKIFINY